jgi:leucyl/phenylalanyl-tRNA--protein transferase
MNGPTHITPELLISAYVQGIFPMGIEGRIGWFSPDPRGIIPLDSFHYSKSLAQTIRARKFETRIDSDFEAVMQACADRPEGTWISESILRAYVRLHEMGCAHSVESWRTGRLVGGLYGVSLGGAFFGESMFHRERDASKVALVALVDRLRERGFSLLDIQYVTPHLERFGAVEIRRNDYLRRLTYGLSRPCQFAP